MPVLGHVPRHLLTHVLDGHVLARHVIMLKKVYFFFNAKTVFCFFRTACAIQ